MKRIIFAFLIVFTFQTNAQDTLKLLSGKSKLIQLNSHDYDFIYYKKVKENGELGRKRKKNLDHIFTVNYKDSARQYFYQQDTMFDNFMSINEMEYYLEGRRQGRKHYKAYKTILIGAALGAGVGMYSLFPLKYNKKEKSVNLRDSVTNSTITVRSFNQDALSIPIPYWEIFPIGCYLYYVSTNTAVSTQKYKADSVDMFKEEAFTVGYKQTVSDRKLLAAFGSSVGSFVMTVVGYFVFDPVEK